MGAEVFVHPNAINESVSVGPGTRIWAFAHVMRGAVVGAHCNIGDHAFVESGAIVGNNVTIKNAVCIWEGVTIQDFAFIGPGVSFTNDRHPRSPRAPIARERYSRKENWLVPTLVGEGASIGAGAVLLPGITIGRYATVGAGATVTRSVPAFAVVAGNPARVVGRVCLCGRPLARGRKCAACGRAYQKRGRELALRNPEDANV